MPFSPKQQNWRWYQDDAAEPSTALAAENAAPALPTNSPAIIRLRLTIAEIGAVSGSGSVTLEYSTDDTNWSAFGSAPAVWNYANGKAAEGGTTTSYKTSDGTTHGLYHENSSRSETWAASAIRELDFAIIPNAVGLALGAHYFRAKISGTIVPLNTGKAHPQVTLSPPGGESIAKGNAYAVMAPPAGTSVTKSIGYAILDKPGGINVAKGVAYAVISLEDRLRLAKGNIYAVVDRVDLSVSKVNAYAIISEEDHLRISKGLAFAVIEPVVIPPTPGSGGLFFANG